MDALFLKLLNMSITASYFVLGIVLLRLLFRKAPKWILVLLWGLVGLRLLLPFSIESKQSLIPSADTVPEQILYDPQPAIQSGIPVVNDLLNPIIAESLTPRIDASVNPAQVYATIAANIWLLGMVLMVAYSLFSYLRLRRSLRAAIPYREHIWICDRLPSPFVLGFFRPRIYIPSDLCEEDLPYVLAHEEAHIHRKDHWWKPLGFLLLTVYWFNPLLWLAYILLCRDIESACDERVLRVLGQEGKKPYSQSLLRCSIPKRRLSACPLAFGEGNLKNRISSILSYKKPTLWILIPALVATAALSLWFLTDPSSDLRNTGDDSGPILWFDELEYQDDCAIDAESLRLPVFPDILFCRSGEAIEIHNAEKADSVTSFGTCLNAFFTDLTQDGIPELCMTLRRSLRSNLHVVVYDISSGSIYSSDQWSLGNYYFKQEGDKVRIICLNPEGFPLYYSYVLECYPVMPDLRETVEDVRTYIAGAEILHIGEPLLVRDALSGTYLFGYSANSLRYPFYMSTTKPLLSLFDEEELLDFLREEIPDCDPISEAMYNTAKSAIKIVELDPSYNTNYTGTDRGWYTKVTKAAKSYYVGSESVPSPIGNQRLTMDDVSALSELGHDLSWDDLKGYESTDIGSGLYVLVYPINDTYELICSGGSLDGKPATVRLRNLITNRAHDIREGQPYQFLLTRFLQTWFDTDTEPLKPIEELELPQFPHTVFSYDPERKELWKTVKNEKTMISGGLEVINAYFYDLNNDHIPELCFTCSSESAESDTQVQIYSLNDGSTYTIDPPSGCDYFLNTQGDELILTYTNGSFSEQKTLFIFMNRVRQNNARLMELELQYPHYFHLDASKGLTVEIRQISSTEIVCELFEGKDADVLSSAPVQTPCGLVDMHLIVRHYKLDHSEITIHATPTAYSQLHYDSGAQYQETMTNLFFAPTVDG